MSGDVRAALAELVAIIERHCIAGLHDFDVPYVAAVMARARALLVKAQPQPVEPTDPARRRQYFYRVDHCTAHNSSDSECCCWHNEGEGPLADDPSFIRSWRDAPVQSTAQLAADIRTACDSTWIHQPAVAVLLELASQMERQPISPDTLRAIATELSRYP